LRSVLSATTPFTFTPKNSFNGVTTPASTVPGEPALDANVSPLSGDDPSPSPIGANAHSSNTTTPDKEPIAVSGPFATSEFANPTALISCSNDRHHQYLKEPIRENASADDPMGLAMYLESPSSSMRA
jgi:hypothetical protein